MILVSTIISLKQKIKINQASIYSRIHLLFRISDRTSQSHLKWLTQISWIKMIMLKLFLNEKILHPLLKMAVVFFLSLQKEINSPDSSRLLRVFRIRIVRKSNSLQQVIDAT